MLLGGWMQGESAMVYKFIFPGIDEATDIEFGDFYGRLHKKKKKRRKKKDVNYNSWGGGGGPLRIFLIF